MTRWQRPGSAASGRRQGGFSLVELLVATALSLWVLMALFTLARGSAASHRTGAALAQMTEEATAVLAQLRLLASQAGYGAPVGGHESGALLRAWQQRPVFGCDGAFADPGAQIEALACAASPGRSSAALALAFQADGVNSLLGSDGKPMDCAGNQIDETLTPAGQRYHLSYSRFYLIGTTLYCKGSGGSGQPLALLENVQAFSVRYGVSARGDGRVSAYLPASQVADWQAVVAVRVCLLMRSAEDRILPEPMTYTGCEAQAGPRQAPDRRLYRAYATTVLLRNATGVMA